MGLHKSTFILGAELSSLLVANTAKYLSKMSSI